MRIITVLLLAAVRLLAVSVGPAAAQPRRPVTFTRDIAPIIFEQCASCHRDGQPAPFALLSYEDVRSRAELIARVTAARYMPPWKPDPGYGQFVGERRLTDDEIGLIQEWVRAGAPEGDRADLPTVPRSEDGWALGPPDVVVSLPAYELPADGPDRFRAFAEKIPMASSRFVRAVELIPSNPRVVHHARILVDRTSTSWLLDEEDPQPGYDGMLIDAAEYPDGHFLGWTPGRTAMPSPSGAAWRLDPGTDVVVQLHLLPTGRPERVYAQVGLYFSAEPPRFTPVVLRLTSKTIDIAPGDSAYVVEDRYQLPVDVEVMAVYPHAHYLARTIEGVATLPGGRNQWLIRISDWDLNWQDEYHYLAPVRLPKGSVITMRYTYDNSAANPRNPSSPPRRVTFGSRSSDEMGELWLQVRPATREDADSLRRDHALKELTADVAGYEKLVADQPNDASMRTGLGAWLLRLGRTSDAIVHLETAVRFNPDLARARYNLGTAYFIEGQLVDAWVQFVRALDTRPDYIEAANNLGATLQSLGRFEEAVERYRQALEINPNHAGAHYNLGLALDATGDRRGAIAEYRRALDLIPDDPDAHYYLGRALGAEGQLAEAVQHYQRAISSRPDFAVALADLAWLFAARRAGGDTREGEAVELARKATELTGNAEPVMLDVLAVAYAAAGRFDDAVATAEKALRLATGTSSDLAPAIQQRLELFRQGRSYRIP